METVKDSEVIGAEVSGNQLNQNNGLSGVHISDKGEGDNNIETKHSHQSSKTSTTEGFQFNNDKMSKDSDHDQLSKAEIGKRLENTIDYENNSPSLLEKDVMCTDTYDSEVKDCCIPSDSVGTEKFCQARESKSDDSDEGESSEEEDDYESADEGEINEEELKELEQRLTDDEKQERRDSASALKDEGNKLFKAQAYKEAIKFYSRALQKCPLAFPRDRAIMYSNRAVCKLKMDKNENAIKDCSKAIDLHPHYIKALIRRAELYEKVEKLDEALCDYQKTVEIDPAQHYARAACMRLPDQIKERNEKLKEEMMGKLKDLGNMILRPFGLSTNNFQLNQDPNTGGYSVNFTQNPENGNGR